MNEDFQLLKFKIEQNKYLLNRVDKWLKDTDNKAIGLTIVSATTYVLFVSLAIKISLNISKPQIVLIGLSFIFLMLINFLVICPNPFSSKKEKETNQISISLKDIADFETKEEFIKTENETSLEDYNNALLDEILGNSKLYAAKTMKFKIGFFYYLISIILIVISLTI